MKKSYKELLLDPRWQKRKTEIMQRDNFTCQMCGAQNKTLHVHHKFYDGRSPWEYEDDALITLCEDCHNKIHARTIPKFGEVYSCKHGDYTNYMVCYGINYTKGFVYLLGFDSGAGNYDIFFIKEYIECFKDEYNHEDNFWNSLYGKEEESYIPSVLINMIVNISLYGKVHPNYFSYNIIGFDYDNDHVVKYAQSKIIDLVNTNDNLLSCYMDITC